MFVLLTKTAWGGQARHLESEALCFCHLTKTQNSQNQLTREQPNQTTQESSMHLSSLFILSSLALFQEGCSSAISALKVRERFFSQGKVSLFSSVTPTNLDPLGRPIGEVELPGHIMHRFHSKTTSNHHGIGHGHGSALSQKVHTTLLMASSPCHTYSANPQNGCRSGRA
jgi:hypothetical protein